jgi:hypothetical protein
MVAFPQHGACLCGDVGYRLTEDPLTLYACHCTDCQRQSGTSFALSMIVRLRALEITRGRPGEYTIEMGDGRLKRSNFCGRCSTRLWGLSSLNGFAVLEPGTLDDTTWLRPVGHIWTRSAQPWLPIPDDTLNFSEQPGEDRYPELVRAWKQRESAM